MIDPCNGLRPEFRDICKCVKPGVSLDECNRRRVSWGMAPLEELPKPQEKLTIVEKAKSATSVMLQTIWRHVSNGDGLLTDDQINARLEICKTCDHFEKNHCQLCGCACQAGNVSKWFNKLAHAASVCPHDPPKWVQADSSAST